MVRVPPFKHGYMHDPKGNCRQILKLFHGNWSDSSSLYIAMQSYWGVVVNSRIYCIGIIFPYSFPTKHQYEVVGHWFPMYPHDKR